MSGIPKLDDKDAMSQQSGEALKYIYAGFENMVAGDKQSGFNEGLQRRLRLICNYLNWLEGRGEYSQDANNPGTGYDADDIEIRWVRNLPAETTTKVTNTMAISTVVSRRTVLENLHEAGMVSDVDAEMKRLEEESALDLGTEDQLAKESYGSL
jgi:SPP1 family phage portal protein